MMQENQTPRFKRFLHAGRLSLFLFLSGLSPALTQDYPIVVKGNERIETATILTHVKIEKAQRLDQATLDGIVRELFKTGLFADVKIHQTGGTIHIAVVENPIVSQVVFDGNKEISDDILKQELSLKPRQVYTLTKLKHDNKLIYDLYRLKGHFAARVTPKIIRRDQNRVDIIFEIEEGQSTVVRKINFIGNKSFDESKLESVIQTKETRWYRFFTSDDKYDPDRLAYDRELLRRFYLENGYVDFQVKSAVAELTPDQKEFFITFTLQEGERYRFGKISLESHLKNIKVEDLQQCLTMQPDDWYSSKELEKTIAALTEHLGAKGYAFVDIQPRTDRSPENKAVSVVFEIQEGPRVYIDTIRIMGNIRTDEDVIRRELRLYEGDAFNSYLLKESQRNLENLGFFKKVEIKQEPSDVADKINLTVRVEEEPSTGEISLGAGYSTTDGPLADIRLTERNLMGRGQEASVGVTWAKRRQEFDASFTEPHFLDRKLAAGFDVFARSTNSYFDQAFTHKTHGATLRLGYDLAEHLTQQVNYSIQRDRIEGIRSDASPFIRQDKGEQTISSVGQTLLFDRRDSRLSPTSGYYAGLGNDFAGVGGDVRYLGNTLYGGYYLPVAEGWVLGLLGRGGALVSLGKRIRVVDRYTIGGDSFRGFQTSGVGPRDRRTKDALGGLRYYVGTAELSFPLGLPEEFGIKGSVFTDVGSLWHTQESRNAIFNDRAPRASVGVGLNWRSPIGTIRVDVAKAVRKQRYDETQIIHIGFGTRY